MGDVLHALIGVAALRRARPGWRIDWVVDERWVPLLVASNAPPPVVSAVIPVRTRAWNRSPLSPATFGALRALRRTLRAAQYDVVVDMQGTLRSAFIGRLSGANVRAGYDDPREKPARWMYTQRVTRTQPHIVDQGAELLSAATGVPLDLKTDTATLPTDARAEAWAEWFIGGRRVALLAASAGWGAKQWPAARFGELALALAARGFVPLISAPRADDTLANAVRVASQDEAQVVASDLPKLIALLRRAALYVGGDTGPTHLAAALGTPLVALYGPTDPARNGPWPVAHNVVLRHDSSQTTYKRVAEIDGGLARLSVEEVLAAAMERVSSQHI
jgi:heptosyltransferase-1